MQPLPSLRRKLLSHATETIPYALKNGRQISHDELGIDMHHAKAKRLKSDIAPGISLSAEPSSVIRPVDLDDEAAGGSEEVDDVLAEHDLPSERDPELSTGQLSPQASFRERGLGAHDTSAFVEWDGAGRAMTVLRRHDEGRCSSQPELGTSCFDRAVASPSTCSRTTLQVLQ